MVFGIDSDSSRSPMPNREVIVLDINDNKCKHMMSVHLRYDWTSVNPRRQYVCCCEVNDNLFHF
jgi:hypothetical protein